MARLSGWSAAEAAALLQKFGPNRLPEKKVDFLSRAFGQITSPVSLMLLLAAGVSYFIGKNADGWIILFLFATNIGISLWHEGKADNSIKKLQRRLTSLAKVRRDGRWQSLDSALVVPGDIVELAVGKLVPADLKLLEAKNLSLDESVLTGESLPKTKEAAETVYSGSFVATGYAVGEVIGTGANTFFGQTMVAIDATPRQSALEKDIVNIAKFVAVVSLIVVVILTLVLFWAHTAGSEILLLDLSLLIAGIPVALPTVMSLIISVGVLALSHREVVVRRLASLEDLANVNLLLSDKTGTLSENNVKVAEIVSLDAVSTKTIVALAAAGLADADNNPLDQAVAAAAREYGAPIYERLDFTPADSERKRSTAVIKYEGRPAAVALGAAQVVFLLCHLSAAQKTAADAAVSRAAAGGYRVLAVALNSAGEAEKGMTLIGLLFLSDALRPEAKATIEFMAENGIAVKMLTGDNLAISERVARTLHLPGKIYGRAILNQDGEELERAFPQAAGFAEILPADKYDLVRLAQKNDYTVAVTGDGVNDLPAVKAADVGLAVANAVDALKSTADIVLLAGGIGVIERAIIEARQIFSRLYNYSLYRISESFRIIITIAVIGLLYKIYPLTPVQLIVLAFLNDVPIVSLAFDRVKVAREPAHINAQARFTLSSLFGLTGVINSLGLLFLMLYWLHLPWPMIQTVFFLKLTVSGHMLIYVAHTTERWFKFLPSWPVIMATTLTQLLVTLFALWGIFTTPISLGLVVLVWGWTFIWMQVSELMKPFSRFLFRIA